MISNFDLLFWTRIELDIETEGHIQERTIKYVSVCLPVDGVMHDKQTPFIVIHILREMKTFLIYYGIHTGQPHLPIRHFSVLAMDVILQWQVKI